MALKGKRKHQRRARTTRAQGSGRRRMGGPANVCRLQGPVRVEMFIEAKALSQVEAT